MSKVRIFPIQPASRATLLQMYPAVACGWPSPALDWSEAELSLDELIGVDSVTTSLAWVTDSALTESGICQDDILVVDSAIQPVPGDIVLALLDGYSYLRRLSSRGQAPALLADTPNIAPLMISDEQSLLIQGVVTWILHGHPGANVTVGMDRVTPTCLDKVVRVGECSTFLVRARGDSMRGAGIQQGDVLVVDRSCAARPGYIVVAIVSGEFTVKRLCSFEGEQTLKPENELFEEIPLIAKDEPELWGTVTWNLRRLLQR